MVRCRFLREPCPYLRNVMKVNVCSNLHMPGSDRVRLHISPQSCSCDMNFIKKNILDNKCFSRRILTRS